MTMFVSDHALLRYMERSAQMQEGEFARDAGKALNVDPASLSEKQVISWMKSEGWKTDKLRDMLINDIAERIMVYKSPRPNCVANVLRRKYRIDARKHSFEIPLVAIVDSSSGVEVVCSVVPYTIDALYSMGYTPHIGS